jgi:hypothetical protein
MIAFSGDGDGAINKKAHTLAIEGDQREHLGMYQTLLRWTSSKERGKVSPVTWSMQTTMVSGKFVVFGTYMLVG